MSKKKVAPKSTSGKKYIFMLKGINTEKIDRLYGISIVSNIGVIDDKAPNNTTKIMDLSSKSTQETISFLDESKKNHKCIVSMINFESHEEMTNNSYDCFWCRNSIPDNIAVIGCPIKYVASQTIKSYWSDISKDKYTIRENITSKHQKRVQNLLTEDNRLHIVDNNYFLVDGIFCSFNCCMAYIMENKHNSLYSMSEMLLLKMYNDIHPNIIPYIEEAPHWRKLKQYGGDLTISQFRDSFNKVEYKNHGISEIIKFKSIGILFEEKLKF